MNFDSFDLKKMFTGQGGTGEALMLVISQGSQSASFLLIKVELFGLVHFFLFQSSTLVWFSLVWFIKRTLYRA